MALLPVSAVVDELLAALQSAAQVILHAPTGAGKSTWLSLKILRSGGLPGRVVMLEPRRLAEQLGERPGQTVGYRMLNESRCGPATRLEVVTEGILTRQLQQDPGLDGVSLVILDEFHERSLQADLALALLLDVQRGLRDDLKVLIMSATLDDRRLSQLLPQAPVIRSAGRSFPVERRYQALPAQTRTEEAIAGAVQQLLRQQAGSLLLFLPGVAEINRVQGLLGERLAEEVVLATNIAETSLTIEGIRLVVDSGLERVAEFDPRSGLDRLTTRRISQASMAQRAVRAGRLSPGVCLHLFSQDQGERAPEHHAPEIAYADVTPFWLELLQWGVNESAQLSWLDAPPALAAAVNTLTALGALDARQRLTPAGRTMAGYGCDPRLGAMLYHAGEDANAEATAALLAAMIEEPPRSGSPDIRDHFYRPLPHWTARARQLRARCGGGGGRPDVDLAPLLLAWCFRDRIARRRDADGRWRRMTR